MILCKSCGFGVSETMRYALKSNACPSCGKTLFGDKHVQEMSAISGRIRSQAFSQNISEDAIFDISLFIMDNYLSINNTEDISDEPENKPDKTSEDSEESLESIRDEIRSEMAPSLDDIDDFESTESEDMRLSRLKRMAKMSNGASKSGPSVRRIST